MRGDLLIVLVVMLAIVIWSRASESPEVRAWRQRAREQATYDELQLARFAAMARIEERVAERTRRMAYYHNRIGSTTILKFKAHGEDEEKATAAAAAS